MKFYDKIFSSVYHFYEITNNDRPGNKDNSIIGAIFTFTFILTINILSFLSVIKLPEKSWHFLVSILIIGCFLIYSFFWKKRYLKITANFENEKNKWIIHLITISYIVLSIFVFLNTRGNS
jgi:hypothetical protein